MPELVQDFVQNVLNNPDVQETSCHNDCEGNDDIVCEFLMDNLVDGTSMDDPSAWRRDLIT